MKKKFWQVIFNFGNEGASSGTEKDQLFWVLALKLNQAPHEWNSKSVDLSCKNDQKSKVLLSHKHDNERMKQSCTGVGLL